ALGARAGEAGSGPEEGPPGSPTAADLFALESRRSRREKFLNWRINLNRGTDAQKAEASANLAEIASGWRYPRNASTAAGHLARAQNPTADAYVAEILRTRPLGLHAQWRMIEVLGRRGDQSSLEILSEVATNMNIARVIRVAAISQLRLRSGGRDTLQ